MTVKRSLFSRTAAIAAAMSLAVTSITVSADETETSPIAADEPMAIAENMPNPKAPSKGRVYNLKGGAKGVHNVNGQEYTTKGSYTEAELLIGLDEIDGVKVRTAKDVTDIYNQKYLLGIASDFSVFLEGNLTVRDSDAEGRVAVGGDVISAAGYNYQIANGDFATATPLALKPGGGYENRKDFAHLIVGGHLEDINTLAKVERQSEYTANYGGEYYKPEKDMFKRFVLNTNSTKTAITNWNASFHQQGQYLAGHNHDGINADELSQFYAAKLIDFPATFEMLRDRSKALRNTGSLYNVGTASVGYKTKEDGTTKMVLEYKGDPTQTVVFEVTEWKNNISEIDIINPNDKGDVEYIINCKSEEPKLANTGGTLRTYLTGAGNKTEEISKIDDVETSNNNKASTRILFNFFNAKKLTISNNFTGTVLAPNADVNSEGKGHLSGALIAKSYDGPIEFGYRPYRGIAAPVTGIDVPTTPDTPEITSTVKISKTDLAGSELPGATMNVYSGTYTDVSQLEGATLVDSWTSSTTPHVLTNIAEGDYTLYESVLPGDEYLDTRTLINFHVSDLGIASLKSLSTNGMYSYDDSTNTIIVVNQKKFTEPTIKLIKTYEDADLAAMAPAERDELLGATKFRLSGNGVDVTKSPAWDDTENKAIVTFTANDGVAAGSITAGTYILSEIDMGITSKGYNIPEKHSFECVVDAEGNVTYREAGTNNPISTEFPEVENVSVKFLVPFSKQDMANGEEIAGAKLSLYRGTYNSAEELSGEAISWTTEAGVRHTENLSGGDYTLYEESAPEGYEKATSLFHFTVTPAGEVLINGVQTDSDFEVKDGVIIIKNARASVGTEGKTRLNISKKNIAGIELSGAQLQLKDASGVVIDEWTSDGTVHSIDVEEGVYTLHEEVAPGGYVVITDVTFSVDANHNVTVINTTTTGKFDAVSNPDGTVSVTVTDDMERIPDTPSGNTPSGDTPSGDTPSGDVPTVPALSLPPRPTDNVDLSATPTHNPESDKSKESSSDKSSGEDVGAGAGMTAQTAAADSSAAMVIMAAGLAAAAAVVRKRRK